MALSFYLILTIASIVCAIVITYYVTLNRIIRKEHEAKIDATRERTVRETKDAMLAELRPEQMITNRRSGWIVKKQWLVINERLRLGDLPISGWVEHEILVDEELDEQKLKLLAESASLFFSPGMGKLTVPLSAAGKLIARTKKT